MDIVAAQYPPLLERAPIPAWCLSLTFLLTLVPFFCRHRRRVAIAILPFNLNLCVLAPNYTFGDPSADYYNSSPFIAIPLWFVEFTIFMPSTGPEAPTHIRDPKCCAEMNDDDNSIGFGAVWSRLQGACSLMVPSHRGIGWNWQVKNIPLESAEVLNGWKFVRVHMLRAVIAYCRSVAMLVILGCGSAVEHRHSADGYVVAWLSKCIVGWSGAIWVWDRLNCFHSLLAFTSVALGICEPWQWPPLMSRLRDAWSVRQMWSSVYHQTMRKIVSQPAIRITRLLKLRKGGFASRYMQLWISFGASCLIHQFQMFNVTRKAMGESVFFMSQPLAIMFEDFVQGIW